MACAQDYPRHEITLGYGLVTTQEAVDILASALTGESLEYKNHTGAFNLQYTYNLSKKFGLGIIGAYEKMSGVEGNIGDYRGDDFSESDVMLMAGGRIYWLNKDYVAIYSKAAIGAWFQTHKSPKSANDPTSNDDSVVSDTDTDVAFQISPFGVEVGGKTVRAYLEGGFGNLGVIQGGVRFRF